MPLLPAVRFAATLCLMAGAAAFSQPGPGDRPLSQHHHRAMKIHITIDVRVIPATLADTAASRDFAAMLPLDLMLTDHAATEKIGDLPKRLRTQGAPAGHEPRPGDIAYYAPWGNLALFHAPFRYSEGLVRLGSIDSGIDILKKGGRLRARIELVPVAAH